MTEPHVHCELIKAWADGAEIQMKDDDIWIDCVPLWQPRRSYRIKPPSDIVISGVLELVPGYCRFRPAEDGELNNVRLTFNGISSTLSNVDLL
jgi:hypothetical protein